MKQKPSSSWRHFFVEHDWMTAFGEQLNVYRPPLDMQGLFAEPRLGDKDAAKVGIDDNDWVEAVNRNGVVVARAIVSHRMPEGTVFMHHTQERSNLTGDRMRRYRPR